MFNISQEPVRRARAHELVPEIRGATFGGATRSSILPVVLVKLNRDPATASSIILTTVTDIVGFFTFLGLATLLADMLAAP